MDSAGKPTSRTLPFCRADIKQYIGLPSPAAIYKIYSSCIRELTRVSPCCACCTEPHAAQSTFIHLLPPPPPTGWYHCPCPANLRAKVLYIHRMFEMAAASPQPSSYTTVGRVLVICKSPSSSSCVHRALEVMRFVANEATHLSLRLWDIAW